MPIGNSKDITLRAIDCLQNVDEIYCEDTRVTNKILSIYKINRGLKNYHDHNGGKVRPQIIKKIKDGKSIALVSDAGTPLISDPGYKLVSELKDNDLYVTAVSWSIFSYNCAHTFWFADKQLLFFGVFSYKNST